MRLLVQIYVPPHPLVKHFLTIARNESTPPSLFRAALGELGRILIYEAGRDFLPTVDTPVTTPMGQAEGTIIDPTRSVKVHNNYIYCFKVHYQSKHSMWRLLMQFVE